MAVYIKRIRCRICTFLVPLLLCALGPQASAAAPDFTTQIKPLFDEHCVKCHGPEKQKGALRFDHRAGAFAKSESGDIAIVPSRSSESKLIKLIKSRDAEERMPPKGDALTESQVTLLSAWIDAGAQWPEQLAATKKSTPAELVVTDLDRQHWSYRPLAAPKIPSVRNTSLVRSPVDNFVLSRLEAKGATLSALAEPLRLVRRIYFDLLGLPPAPEQLLEFQRKWALEPQSAVSDLIEELLASPHYGERWARHWLDLARYADSDGQESDADRPTAYHYRDFVITSLNEDSPFDRFLRWQIAGDEIEPDEPQAIAATGFIVAGTHAGLEGIPMEEEKIRTRFNELDDMISTTSSAMLGLTLACARCHDHKYDPIPRRDYYRILCAFNGGDRAEVPLVPLAESRQYREQQKIWKQQFETATKLWEESLNRARKSHESEARDARIDALKASDDEKALLRSGKPNKDLAKKFSKELKVEDNDLRGFLSAEEGAEWDRRKADLKSLEARKPKPLPSALAFSDYGPKPHDNFLLARGDFRARSEPVELGFLTVLTHGKNPEDYWAAARRTGRRQESSQQRRALADWMTDLDHGAGALAARVIVNRVWQHHFGEGLVRTVNDFGIRGEAPTHPELLEWLTSEFVRSGWKLKTLHRLILRSSTYLQSSAYDEASAAVDPDNRLLSRRRPLRLEAEVLRDAILTVSGTLNDQMLGPAVKAPITPEAIQARNMRDPYPKDLKDSPATHRRSIYLFHKRVVQQPLMQAFDGPDAQASCGRRENTTVAPQALALLNDPFIRARANDFARRLAREAGASLERRVRLGWELAMGRNPSESELQSSLEYINSRVKERAGKAHEPQTADPLALADFCQALFAMNEFIYVD
ncbi:MAG TPA: PSD1 and planctomycete cytochrome C domain-containing protein [Candidatus Saccharimonadales bacterium]|nr:PSD1 and planctomycete cytochrome C domain-containing protein [Candidatus Saccharimonadales bacterium]